MISKSGSLDALIPASLVDFTAEFVMPLEQRGWSQFRPCLLVELDEGWDIEREL